jgi:hypothetical protein
MNAQIKMEYHMNVCQAHHFSILQRKFIECILSHSYTSMTIKFGNACYKLF